MFLVPPSFSSPPKPPSPRPQRLSEQVKAAISSLGIDRNQLVNEHLLGICHALQLPESERAIAEKVYNDLGGYLLESVQLTDDREPVVYPQGSMRQKTTVRPLIGDIFDLDFVLELPWEPKDPVVFLDQTHEVVRKWQAERGYKFGAEQPKKRDRCIEIKFSKGRLFSMDVVPACKDKAETGTHIKIVDKSLRDWKSSNPKELACWFDKCGELQFILQKEAAVALSEHANANVEKLEPEQAASDKPILKLIVQLAKRARDQFHRGDDPSNDLSTPSILLTVLIAKRYRGSANLAGALLQAAYDLRSVATETKVPPKIYNPGNDNETISDKWERKPESWEAFGKWTENFLTRIVAISTATDATTLRRLLAETFGKRELDSALKEMAIKTDEAVQNRNQPIAANGRVGAPIAGVSKPISASIVVAPATTFYGD